MLPGCTGNCNQGRCQCDCVPMPAEACTELGADDMTKPRIRQQITDLVLAVLLVLMIVLLSLSWELIK